MKKSIKTIIAMALLLIMATISPMTDLSQSLGGSTDEQSGQVAKAAETAKAAEADDTSGGRYISEVRLGMGNNKSAAYNYLVNNGFRVLTNGADNADSGYDLNEGAGDKDRGRKNGDKSKVVMLGYKTTNDPKKAITDLAVMNMEGGYSVRNYAEILRQNMETRIRPFMNRFIATLNEYRENLKKPEDAENFKRADYMRKLLNKMTDDDTDGTPIGDLLVNKTKFEMGDAAYGSLSASEKNKHADIITMFQQGDDAMLYLLCNLLARAADTSEDSWIDRLAATSLEDLSEEVQASKNVTTLSDINAILDKKYEDAAKSVLSHWGDVSEKLNDLAGAEEIVDNYDEGETQDLAEQLENFDEKSATAEELNEMTEEITEQSEKVYEVSDATVTVEIGEYLEGISYEFEVGGEKGDNLLDFFRLSASDFSGNNIRALYPLVDTLSEGQLAGLDYLSLKDMIYTGMGIRDDNIGALKEIDTISFYNAVNREIYDADGVALTNDALRKEASQKPINQEKEEVSVGNVLCIVAVVSGIVGAGLIALAKILTMTAEWSKGTIGMLSGGIFLAVSTLALLIVGFYMISDEFDVSYKSIPKYIVDEVDIISINEKGEKVFVKNQTAYYKAVTCNRPQSGSELLEENYRLMGDRGDLNGDIGKQWLALYAVKNVQGTPILADSFKCNVKSSSIPDGYSTGIHEFGSAAVANLNKRAYLFGADPPEIYVYFKTDAMSVEALSLPGVDPGAAGSLFADDASGSNSGSGITMSGVVLGGGIGIVLGGLLGALIMYFSRKKKVTVEKEER